MLWMAVSYLVMLISAYGLGMGAFKGISVLCDAGNKEVSPVYYLMTGFAVLTVYAQIVSLFTAVTYVSAFIALGVSVMILMLLHKSAAAEIRACLKEVLWYEYILFPVFIIFVMFLTSLYPKQYDNYLYQAQMLRYYEEYGIVKGMGNISTRLGFNNSIYALMALYSFKGIYGFSLHTVNSALCVFFGIYAIHGLCRIGKTRAYVSTGLKGAVLAYVFYNAELLNCIGTDLSAGIFGFVILVLFAEAAERKEKDTFLYGVLALHILYVVTVKVSMGILGILAFYPVFLMIKKKEWRRIAVFIPGTISILLPWLVRNVLISGWLIYPFPVLDLFDVKWKLPYQSVVYEAALIKGWARIRTSQVFSTVNMGFGEWFPLWFRALPLRYRLLLYLNGMAFLYETSVILYGIFRKRKEVYAFGLLKATVFTGILYWLFSAPDIRFGWCYLVAFPVICIFSSGIWQKIGKISIHKLQVSSVLFVCMVFSVCLYTFIKADGIKALKDSIAGRINSRVFYIYQADFAELPVEEYVINGDVFYWSPEGDQTGYYGFPGTTDKALLDNLGYLGKKFEDGVYDKGGQSW